MAVEAAAKVTRRKSSIPVLAGVVLTASPAGLRLISTDLDIVLDELVPARVEEAGAVLVSARGLRNGLLALYELPWKGLELAIESDGARLIGSRIELSLPAISPVSKYPTFSTGEFTHQFDLPALVLRNAIDRIRFAISAEETRYYLNGIYLHATKNDEVPVIRAVATDGHRLALVNIAAPEGGTEIPGTIVPRKAIRVLRRVIRGDDNDVHVEISVRSIRFRHGGMTLTSKVIDGKYPDYEPKTIAPFLADEASGTILVRRADLARAADALEGVASRLTRCALQTDGGRVLLSVIAEDGTVASATVTDCEVAGLPVSSGINLKYLADLCGASHGKWLSLGFYDSDHKPIFIRDLDNPDWLALMMPMRR
ncbi:MAG: DNA polymerase III subunit beta [Alphaproteobacteria bacterium]|nr:DNA polymerase III subunit beta [Alphaproteobacteria bacterium]